MNIVQTLTLRVCFKFIFFKPFNRNVVAYTYYTIHLMNNKHMLALSITYTQLASVMFLILSVRAFFRLLVPSGVDTLHWDQWPGRMDAFIESVRGGGVSMDVWLNMTSSWPLSRGIIYYLYESQQVSPSFVKICI